MYYERSPRIYHRASPTEWNTAVRGAGALRTGRRIAPDELRSETQQCEGHVAPLLLGRSGRALLPIKVVANANDAESTIEADGQDVAAAVKHNA